MEIDRVSIIIRTTIGRLHSLDHALFSILGNDYPDVEVIIVVQALDDHYYSKVCALVEFYSKLGLQAKLVRNPTDVDQRAKNLNLGVDEASGRYIGFLDDDDVFYPDHISSLVYLLQDPSSSTWAFSKVRVVFFDVDAEGELYITSQKLHSQRQEFSYAAFWQDNYIPLHSFLIDRERVEASLIHFDESFRVLEDYSFLLRLSSFYKPDHLPKVTCEYRLRLDGSNTSSAVEELNSGQLGMKRGLWNSARFKLAQMKRELLLLPLPKREVPGATVASMLLEHYQNELAWYSFHLHQCQAEAQWLRNDVAYLRERIAAMETSKFWKLRKVWMKLKRLVGLPNDS